MLAFGDEGHDWAEQVVREALSRFCGKPALSFRLEDRLDTHVLDSLDLVEFIMQLEDEFSVELEETSSTVNTVGDLVDLVRRSQSE